MAFLAGIRPWGSSKRWRARRAASVAVSNEVPWRREVFQLHHFCEERFVRFAIRERRRHCPSTAPWLMH